MENNLAFSPATEVRRLIADREVSPVELTGMFLERIDALDGKLNSYLTVSADSALAEARAAEDAVMSGEELGPLHGVPISVKDLEMSAGIRTTGGSLLFEDRVPAVDSAVVERVKAAGAVILGKTNTPEFGLLGHTQNRLGDHCRNPWNTERTTGGSSGGAGASVVAGLCTLATGSDGGGSIRIPAALCGIYGIKPTQGRVPLYPGVPSPPFANHFSQSGPMTRTVRDSALLLQVLAGHYANDVNSLRTAPGDYMAAADSGTEGLRIAWSPDYGYGAVERDVDSRCREAAGVFEDLGCTVDEVDLALDSPIDAFWDLFCSVSNARYAAMVGDNSDLLTDYGRTCIEHGATVSGPQYARALGTRADLMARFGKLLDEYDLLLSPTLSAGAFPVGEPPSEIDGKAVDKFSGFFPFTYPINMIGHPAASIPCGFTNEDLPVGLHIVGRWGDEETIIAASAAFEEARPWAHLRPPVS
jgi:aspartyl-tRNA(Asn)/glutamyl-tRNA(Gln) amidotransferase subunit A